MESVKIALLKQNGDTVFKDFNFCNDFDMSDLEILVENKGNNFEIIEEEYVNNRYFYLLGYKSGNKFSKHHFNNCNLFDDSIMIVFNDIKCIDIEQFDINNYFASEIIYSDSSINFSEDDEYDFNDGFLINDLYDL